MTISTTTNRWAYNGDGATTAFVYTNKIFDDSDLKVYVGGDLKTLTTDYTVSGAGNAGGGNVTFTSAPASGTLNVVIVRNVPATQATDLVDNGAFPAQNVEDALDKVTVLAQQNADRVARALLQPDTDADAIAALPDKVSRASKYLAFDAASNPLAAAPPEGGNVVSAFMATVLDDADAATARATLGASTVGDALFTAASAKAARQGVVLDTHGADIASAATIDLDSATGDLVDVTGTTSITAITLAEGVEKTVRFTGALTVTNGASLVLPGAANITTAAGDYAVFRGYAAGVVRCVNYTRASSVPIDNYKPSGSWTPADGSGASLTFTGVSAQYTRVGNLVFAYGTVTYPTTANGSNATISGLPFTVANADYARQGRLSYSSTSNAVFALPNKNATTFGIYTSAGAAATNAQLSGVQIFFLLIYPVA